MNYNYYKLLSEKWNFLITKVGIRIVICIVELIKNGFIVLLNLVSNSLKKENGCCRYSKSLPVSEDRVYVWGI